MEELIYTKPKKVSEFVDKNSTIKDLFFLYNKAIYLEFSSKDFNYKYNDFQIGTRFILKIRNFIPVYHYCHVIDMRHNAIFYVDELTNKENHITINSSKFRNNIFPTKILAGSKENMKITCSCKLTEIIYE
mgnify:CR=1 FL=1